MWCYIVSIFYSIRIQSHSRDYLLLTKRTYRFVFLLLLADALFAGMKVAIDHQVALFV